MPFILFLLCMISIFFFYHLGPTAFTAARDVLRKWYIYQEPNFKADPVSHQEREQELMKDSYWARHWLTGLAFCCFSMGLIIGILLMLVVSP